MQKVNCWEFKKCGREPGGAKAKEMGVCPAAQNASMDGLHGGRFGGRACWVVVGTFCQGKVQGSFAQKYSSCSQCDFYTTVRNDEGHSFLLSPTLLTRLR